jgi:(1->4)-alpha-D-glucan 1-alpha-D-glucosylmutase
MLFAHGSYHALRITGERQRHAFAFARRHDQAWVVTVFPRLAARLRAVYGLADDWPLGDQTWAETALVLPASAPVQWINELSGESLTFAVNDEGANLPLAQLFRHVPFALLTPSNPGAASSMSPLET